MFKPVAGSELNQFDQETRNLFRRRESDPRDSADLARIPRRQRHHLPVIVDSSNPEVQEWENESRNMWWKLGLSFAFFGKHISFK